MDEEAYGRARRRERADVLRRTRRRRARSLTTGLVTVGVFAGAWFGTSAIRATQNEPLAVLTGTTHTVGGYRYTVEPGDTLWSIASRLSPSGDPRPIVAELESETGSATVQPGEQLLLP